jgi:hypothetical protein
VVHLNTIVEVNTCPDITSYVTVGVEDVGPGVREGIAYVVEA